MNSKMPINIKIFRFIFWKWIREIDRSAYLNGHAASTKGWIAFIRNHAEMNPKTAVFEFKITRELLEKLEDDAAARVPAFFIK